MLLSHWALLGFAVWTLLLVVAGIGGPRVTAVLTGEARPSSFRPDVPHGSERYQRTMRAHMNCVENLPVFASLVLLGTLLDLRDQAFQTIAFVVLPARVLQSVTHIASGRNRAVLVRFTFFVVQLLCFALLIALVLRKALER